MPQDSRNQTFTGKRADSSTETPKAPEKKENPPPSPDDGMEIEGVHNENEPEDEATPPGA